MCSVCARARARVCVHKAPRVDCVHVGSSTETVAFQVYEILKINHEFLQFF